MSLEKERERVCKFLDQVSEKLREIKFNINESKKPKFLSYDHIDEHLQEIVNMQAELHKLKINEDYIQA